MSKATLRIRKYIANKLLDRKQFVVDLTHPGAEAPTREQIAEKVASKRNTKKELCVIFGLKTIFGGGRTTGFCFVYDSLDALKQIEPNYRKIRAGLAKKDKSPRRARKDAKIKAAKVWGSGVRSSRHKTRRQQRKEEIGNQ